MNGTFIAPQMKSFGPKYFQIQCTDQKVPFWQFFRKGQDGRALLVQPSRIPHRISNTSILESRVCAQDTYVKTQGFLFQSSNMNCSQRWYECTSLFRDLGVHRNICGLCTINLHIWKCKSIKQGTFHYRNPYFKCEPNSKRNGFICYLWH